MGQIGNSKYMIFEKLPIHFQYSTSVRCRSQESEEQLRFTILGTSPTINLFHYQRWLNLVNHLIANNQHSNQIRVELNLYRATVTKTNTIIIIIIIISSSSIIIIIIIVIIVVEVAGQYLSPETNHAGMFFQDGLTGSAWGDWANYTDSPIRAFEADGGWTLEGLLYFLKGPGRIVIR